MKDVEIIGMLKSYVSATLVGMGALKGAPCQCVITQNADGTHTVTMKWVDNEGDPHTDDFIVLNGQVGKFADISDVSLTNLQDGQVVAYNSTTQKWENVMNSATVNTLNSVGDVTITAVQDGEALVWDDTAGKWVNKDVSVTIDSVLSSTSENPVQNKVLYLALEDKADKATTLSGYGIADAYTKTETDNAIAAEIEKLDVADSVVAGSYVTAVSEADGKISVTREAADETPTANSKKMLTSGGAKTALDAKQDTLTFDNAPTENSANPVKSGGVYTANRNIYEVMGKNGAKNLSKPINSTTYNDITVVCDSDGVLTVTGTASASGGRLNMTGDPFTLKAGTYKVVQNSDDLTKYSSIVCHRKSDNTTLGYVLIENGTINNTNAQFTLAADTECFLGMNTYLGTNYGTGEGTKEYAMVVLADDTDTTYQPYAKTNRELTSEQGYCTEDQYTAIQTLLS